MTLAKFWRGLLGLGAAILLFPTSAAEGKKLKIVTTILPVYCFASAVAGNQADVQNLLPPNIGPHDYQLSPSDLRKLKEADLVIFNGAGLDNWIMKALANADQARVLELGKQFKNELIDVAPDLDMASPHKHGHDHQHGPGNPHFWLDPQMAIRCVTNILGGAQKLDPAHSAEMAGNAEAYIARLKKLDAEIAEKLAPVKDKPFITQHDAFPYFIRHYGLNLAGVVETTPEVQPSPRYLADLHKVIREKKVKALFAEPFETSRLTKQIARDANIRLSELDTLERGVVSPDAYEEGMRRNAATLAKELK
jgi:zinc transport system substrate-binding protein